MTKGKGWKTHVPFHTYLPSTAKPLPDKRKKRWGGATAKVEPFKVYLFDEDANSLVAFQTIQGERKEETLAGLKVGPWRCSGPLTKSYV